MMNKRILKTGALAVAMTVVFAIFAFRAADWTKGLSSEFIVYGQSTGGTSGGTTGGSTGSSTTKIVAQIASGNFGDIEPRNYGTVMEIVNPGTTAVTLSGNFYKEDGTASTVSYTASASTLTITGGAFSNYSLPAGGILVISTGTTTANTPTVGSTNWGKFTGSGNISVTSFFELRHSASRALAARVGVAASSPTLGSFVVARVREKQTLAAAANGANDIDTGFALVNTGTASAVVTVAIKDVNGQTIGTKAVALTAGQHIANFASLLFSDVAETAGQGRQYQYLRFDSNPATIAAVGLSLEGGSLSSFPVDPVQ
jgi:hypothetical protein